MQVFDFTFYFTILFFFFIEMRLLMKTLCYFESEVASFLFLFSFHKLKIYCHHNDIEQAP